MGRKFDLSSLMETVSNLDTTAAAPSVQLIPLEDILDNKANFYRVDPAELKPLADSIAMDGLQQYPLVTPHPDQPGKYLLLSGHRRCAAIRMLVDEGAWDVIGHSPNDRPGGASAALVPCTVRRYESPAMAELQLILANSTARVLTNAEIAKQAERMELLLYQLREEGYEFPGRMRDQVAAACKVSAPKLARLKVIREKLKAPEFLLLFETDKLPEQTAYALARLPEDLQQRLALISTDIPGNVADMLLKKCGDGWRWEPEMLCPDGKTCKRGDSFLRHDLEHPYEMCGGRTCCLECPRAQNEYAPCDRMCSKAQAVRKEKRDSQKAEAEAKAQELTRQYQRETQANARRVLRAIEAAGLPDDTRISWEYHDQYSVGQVREYAEGHFPEDKRWFGAELSRSRLGVPAQTAKVLGCSTDYLLGVTDGLGRAEPLPVPPPEPAPAPGGGAEISAMDRAGLDKLYELLADAEEIDQDVASVLRWALEIIERALGAKL